jgi:flagellar basal-body rod protein FlgB
LVSELLWGIGVAILGLHQQVMEAALQLRSTRAELLAANLANADTPGYLARDIDFDQALQSLIGGITDQRLSTTKTAALENLRYDKNDIDSSQELAKAYDNSLSYVATLKLYGDSIERLKSAVSMS